MVLEAPPTDKHLYLLDVTMGRTREVTELLDFVDRRLGQPPELARIYSGDFDFSRVRVSVQLSEKLPDPVAAFERETERRAGRWRDGDDMERQQWRSAEEYERKRGQAPARDWEDVRGDILQPNFQRGIVLGDPGFGKSWLLRYEGRQLAQAELNRLHASQVGTAGVKISLFASLAELGRKDGTTFLARLKQVLADNQLPHLEKLWQSIEEKARNGDALLLLDGWDEVDRDKREALSLQLEQLVSDNPNCRLLLTSRFAGFEPINLNATRWDLVTLSPTQVTEFIKKFFEPHGATGEQLGARLAENLRTNFQIGELGRIPLMLALLCRLYWQRAGADLPTRRVEIYEECLKGLTLTWKRKSKRNLGDEVAKTLAELRLDFAAELALKMFLNYEVVDARKSKELKALMREDFPDALTVARNFDALIADGILVRETPGADGPLRFIHLTFQEYLAASAIAKRIDNDGWLAKFKAGAATVTAERLVDAKSWDPKWQEVIKLTAGNIHEPNTLLKLLGNPRTDDVLRHRTRLAACCLDYLKSPGGRNIVKQIGRDLFMMRHQPLDQELTAVLRVAPSFLAKQSNLSRAIRILPKLANVLVNQPAIVELLIKRLRDKTQGVRYAAYETLAALGYADQFLGEFLPPLEQIDTESILETLYILNTDTRLIWSRSLDWVLPLWPKTWDQWGRLTSNKNEFELTRKLGKALANDPKIIAALFELLDRNVKFSGHIASALVNLLEFANSKTIIIDKLISHMAVAALGELRTDLADIDYDHIIHSILAIVENEKFGSGAIVAVGQLSEARPNLTSGIVDKLLVLSTDASALVRVNVSKVLAKSIAKSVVDRPRVIHCLLQLLDDSDGDVLCAVLDAIEHIIRESYSADMTRIFEKLYELQFDDDRKHNDRGVESDDPFSIFFGCADHRKSHKASKRAAERATCILVRFSDLRQFPQTIERFDQLLQDDSFEAIYRYLGEVCARSDMPVEIRRLLIGHLIRLMAKPVIGTCRVAIGAASRLLAPGDIDERLILKLLELSDNSADEQIRAEAIDALSNLGVRVFRRRFKKSSWRSISELSTL